MAKIKHTIHTFGLSESAIAERIAEYLMNDNPTVDTKASKGGVSIIITATGYNREDADILCKPIIDSICQRIDNFVCGVDVNIQEHVVNLLKEKHIKIALAESCTAGKLSERLTEVPGVSEVFELGIVSYSHEMKHSLLGVSDELLKEKGAVSAEVATAMAIGARLLGNASIGVSITGAAGPDPSDGQPVGTVYLALADSKRVWIRKLNEKKKNREEIRETAVYAALDLIRRYLDALPGLMAGSQAIEKHGTEKVITSASIKKQSFGDNFFIWRAKGKADFLRRLAIHLLIIALIVGCSIAANKFLFTPLSNEQIYDDLKSSYNAPVQESPEKENKYPEKMLSQFYSLYDQNPDIAGWISIDNTTINYPIMGNSQGEYYSNHDFKKKESKYGVPYFSSSTDILSNNQEGLNYTVYGNNIDSNQMFSSLPNYLDKTYFLNHQFLTMNTIYETARWQVVGVMICDSANNNKEFNYANNTFDTKDDHMEFIKEIESRLIFKPTLPLNTKDSLLLLSTQFRQENEPSTERIVVVAKKIFEEEIAVKDLKTNLDVVFPANYNGAMPTLRASSNQSTTQSTSTTTKKE